MQDLTMYVLVNSDIEMSAGKLAGQVGHVVERYINKIRDISYHIEVWNREYRQDEINEMLTYEDYQTTNTKKIILKCKQSKLEKYAEKYVHIRDNGLTELEPNTLTCVCLGIIDRNNIPKELKEIKRMRLY